MLNADNGIDWALSIAPDQRIPVMHEELRKIKGADFEGSCTAHGIPTAEMIAIFLLGMQR